MLCAVSWSACEPGADIGHGDKKRGAFQLNTPFICQLARLVIVETTHRCQSVNEVAKTTCCYERDNPEEIFSPTKTFFSKLEDFATNRHHNRSSKKFRSHLLRNVNSEIVRSAGPWRCNDAQTKGLRRTRVVFLR